MTSTLETAAADVQDRARQTYRQRTAAGSALSGRALGNMFGKSERWGRDRIAEVRQADGTRQDDDTRELHLAAALPDIERQPVAAETAETADVPAAELIAAEPKRQPKVAATATDETESLPVLRGAKAYALGGFLFGTLISIGANVLQAWLPVITHKPDLPPGWTPSVFQQGLAAVWPIALLFSIEILSRVSWRSGWQWKVTRYGGVIAAAVSAAVISYGHLFEVLRVFDYGAGAYVGPLAVDGLMIVSGFAMLSMADTRKQKQP
jgi:hypothetical protein